MYSNFPSDFDENFAKLHAKQPNTMRDTHYISSEVLDLKTISEIVSILLKHEYGIIYNPKNVPNKYLKS